MSLPLGTPLFMDAAARRTKERTHIESTPYEPKSTLPKFWKRLTKAIRFKKDKGRKGEKSTIQIRRSLSQRSEGERQGVEREADRNSWTTVSIHTQMLGLSRKSEENEGAVSGSPWRYGERMSGSRDEECSGEEECADQEENVTALPQIGTPSKKKRKKTKLIKRRYQGNV